LRLTPSPDVDLTAVNSYASCLARSSDPA
jgi:hypothetical protein